MSLEYLKYDPLLIFRYSKTPAGLYARQKWLQAVDYQVWLKDFRQSVDTLLSGQLENGSWDDSLLETVRRLFGLHLTLRNRNSQIERGLEWLLTDALSQRGREDSLKRSFPVSARDLVNLPFSKGCYDYFAASAILFLASLFGYEHDDRVIGAYEQLAGIREGRKGRWCNWSCSNNILRACIAHPTYRESRSVRLFVTALRKVQKPDGSWPAPIPFYQTINALGHLNFEESDAMLKRAFRRLLERQNKNGTWGNTQKEWNTFLIVHAIKRKNSLMQQMQHYP